MEPRRSWARRSCARYAHSRSNPSGTILRTGRKARSPRNTSQQAISAPAHTVDGAATVHRCSSPHSDAWCTDAWGYHGARDRTRPQHDARSDDATDRIIDVLAVNHRTGLFGSCSKEPGHQCRKSDQSLHVSLHQLFFCSRATRPGDKTAQVAVWLLQAEACSAARLPFYWSAQGLSVCTSAFGLYTPRAQGHRN